MIKPTIYTLFFIACLALLGCSSRIKTPALPSMDVKQELSTGRSAAIVDDSNNGESQEAFADGCLAAWRKALHDDEKGAMAQLQDLKRRYPKAYTLTLMMGQVEEHAGK